MQILFLSKPKIRTRCCKITSLYSRVYLYSNNLLPLHVCNPAPSALESVRIMHRNKNVQYLPIHLSWNDLHPMPKIYHHHVFSKFCTFHNKNVVRIQKSLPKQAFCASSEDGNSGKLIFKKFRSILNLSSDKLN